MICRTATENSSCIISTLPPADSDSAIPIERERERDRQREREREREMILDYNGYEWYFDDNIVSTDSKFVKLSSAD